MKIFIFCSVLVIIVRSTNGMTHPEQDALYKNLTANYNTDIRPTFNLSQPTIVNITFSLVFLKDYVEKTSKLSLSGIVLLTWYDYQMIWNPDDHGGIETFFVQQNVVWKPEILLMNPFGSVDKLGFDRLKIRVLHTGKITWESFNVFHCTCPGDFTNYPFDEQTCSLAFHAWRYLPSEVHLNSVTDKANMENFEENGLWKLKDTNINEIVQQDTHLWLLSMTIKRRSDFIVINTMIPTSILGLLSTLVFVLPAESGERIGFSITVLLSLAFFLSIATDSLPETSEPAMPKLSIMLLGDLLVGTFVTVCTILGLHFHHKSDEEPVPRWIHSIICARIFKVRNRVFMSNNKDHADVPDNLKNHAFNVIEQNSRKESNGRENGMCEIDGISNGEENQPNRISDVSKSSTWKDFALFLDKVMFVFFFVFSIVKNILSYVSIEGI